MSFFIDHSSDCIGLLYMRAVYSLMYESQQRRSSFMNCILQWSHRILIPDELDIFKVSERFVEETSKRPHFCRMMTQEAQEWFDGYSVMFNTRGDAHRRGRCADKAAEEGIAPWKIGMLAACLCLWDTMWGVRTRRV